MDDRALNKDVVDALRDHLPSGPISIIEVGAGIGTMLKRLVTWDLFRRGEYFLVDSMQENIAYARECTPAWAAGAGMSVEWIGTDHLHLCDQNHDMDVRFECKDVFDFTGGNKTPADILIAHAYLDLLPMPKSLKELLSLTKELAWLTINFDGLSSRQPVIDPTCRSGTGAQLSGEIWGGTIVTDQHPARIDTADHGLLHSRPAVIIGSAANAAKRMGTSR